MNNLISLILIFSAFIPAGMACVWQSVPLACLAITMALLYVGVSLDEIATGIKRRVSASNSAAVEPE